MTCPSGDCRANAQYASELPICAALAIRQTHFGPRIWFGSRRLMSLQVNAATMRCKTTRAARSLGSSLRWAIHQVWHAACLRMPSGAWGSREVGSSLGSHVVDTSTGEALISKGCGDSEETHCRGGCDECLYCAGDWSKTIRAWPIAPCSDDDPHRQRRGRRNRGHRLDQVLRIGPSSPRDRSPDQARRDRRTSRTERSRQDDDDRHDPRPATPRCRSGQRVRPPTG